MRQWLLTVAVFLTLGSAPSHRGVGSSATSAVHPLCGSHPGCEWMQEARTQLALGTECIPEDSTGSAGHPSPQRTEVRWNRGCFATSGYLRESLKRSVGAAAVAAHWVVLLTLGLLAYLSMLGISVWTYRAYRREIEHRTYLAMRLEDLISAKARDERTIRDLRSETRILQVQLEELVAAQAEHRETIEKLSEVVKDLTQRGQRP